jgi:Protein of unknown function (DUF2934)
MLSKTVSPILNLYGDLLAAHIRFGRSLARIWSRPVASVPTAFVPAASVPAGSLPAGSEPAVAEDLLQARAYELYLQRGGQPGHEAEDWDRARAEFGMSRLN